MVGRWRPFPGSRVFALAFSGFAGSAIGQAAIPFPKEAARTAEITGFSADITRSLNNFRALPSAMIEQFVSTTQRPKRASAGWLAGLLPAALERDERAMFRDLAILASALVGANFHRPCVDDRLARRDPARRHHAGGRSRLSESVHAWPPWPRRCDLRSRAVLRSRYLSPGDPRSPGHGVQQAELVLLAQHHVAGRAFRATELARSACWTLIG
jgi:hypothetical protein